MTVENGEWRVNYTMRLTRQMFEKAATHEKNHRGLRLKALICRKISFDEGKKGILLRFKHSYFVFTITPATKQTPMASNRDAPAPPACPCWTQIEKVRYSKMIVTFPSGSSILFLLAHHLLSDSPQGVFCRGTADRARRRGRCPRRSGRA